MEIENNKLDKLIRMESLTKFIGLSRSQIYKMQKEGSFPKAVRLSARAVAWKERDVQDWIRQKSN